MEFGKVFLLCAIIACAFGSKVVQLRKRDNTAWVAPVKPGTSECVSNCSRTSHKGNVHMECSIEECGYLKSSEKTPQPSEIPQSGVYFETYYDEKKKTERLALHITWSPVDNVSLENTIGYVVNITDGETGYVRCYSVTTPMDFSNNAHDTYYNDCFGKAPGTYVKPGSIITVQITALPMWKHDKTDGMVTVKIPVPNCNDTKLGMLEECQPKGGRPTTQQCLDSCNTTSNIGKSTHPVRCTISKSSLETIGAPDKCADVNKTADGIPTPPMRVKQQQEWYKYIDPTSKEVKIALNFSWTPRIDSSLSALHGYYLEILPTTFVDLTFFNKCFAVHTHLKSDKHHKAVFYYDCYGRIDGSTVKPGDSYHVHLNSLPSNNGEKENFAISIPPCEDERVQDVSFCIEERKKVLNVSVDKIFCENRTAKVTYHVTPHYGKRAALILCEAGKQLKSCDKKLKSESDLTLSNTLYNVSLKSTADLSLNYTILVYGEGLPRYRAKANPNFAECIAKEPPVNKDDPQAILVIIILIIGIFCAAGILFLVLFICKKDCNFKEWIVNKSRRRNQEPATVMPTYSAQPAPQEQTQPLQQQPQEIILPPTIPVPTRVYVIFSPDCDKHKNIVYWFCSFLKEDLGLDVRVSLWEEEEVNVNPIQYVLSNLKHADKVVVICSEGTKNCLSEEYNGKNLHAAAIKHICNQAFIGQTPGKYLVGYFPYSTQEHVPEMLRDQCLMYFSLFKLMKQFEPFYFRLIGQEQYQEGGIQRIEKIAFDRYHERELTKHGQYVKAAIEDMEAFVLENPTWYNDSNGSELPQAASQPIPRVIAPPNHNPYQSVMDPDPTGGHSSIVHIHAVPPVGLPPSRAAPPPKMDNIDSLPPAAPPHNGHRLYQMPQPTSRRGRNPNFSSVTSTSTDGSSFIIPDTEVEELSSESPTGPDSPANPSDRVHFSYAPRKKPSADSLMFPSSFHPESFNESDYNMEDLDEAIDSRLLTNLPSNLTEITRLGLTESMERLRDESERNLIPPVFQATDDDQGPQVTPESGVFMLANIDEDDGDDIEEQFKSINLSIDDSLFTFNRKPAQA